ncbi:protein-disulfide reductase DsbD [Aquirhabdus parva]|uniref:Protein-disulfide reductase DsbD n=1 Tax=Aquirhabdus parva TaxID=2283318 RepID=A0A345P3P7_9GAMM|nr:protein-disulfide reductase DsbD [Aquirhabdus parva]AXI01906.1 protein-disulfide reductase DsbD [Aquirhabdus parva]
MQRLKSSGELFRVKQQMDRDQYLECFVHSQTLYSARPSVFSNMQRMIYLLPLLVFSLFLGQQSQANVAFNNTSASSPVATDFGKKSLLDNAKIDSNSAIKSIGSPQKFIPADQAFKVLGEAKDGKLFLDFQVTPGYYLYQRRFAFTPESGSVKFQEASFNHPAQIKDDPEFGKVPVFHDDVSVTVPYTGSGKVVVRWQGCADAGLCYPPQDHEFTLPAAAINIPAPSSTAFSSNSLPLGAPILPAVNGGSGSKANPDVPLIEGRPDIRTNIEKSAGVQSILIPLPTPNSTSDTYAGVQSIASLAALRATKQQDNVDRDPVTSPVSVVAPTLPEPTTASAVAPTVGPTVAPTPVSQEETDPFGLSQHPLTALALLFVAGLGLAFTPCVLPMLPIVANLVARQHRRSMKHGLLLSGAYAVGIACCYAVLGAAIATFGQQFNLLGWLQNPVILIGFAIVFVVLALASFDVFTLRLPHSISTKLDSFGQREHSRFEWLKQGSVLGSWLTGFVSALVVSPCVSAPLAGVLLSVSTVGNPVLGAAALFMLGLGLGVPLMILGATEGRFLPKAGDWLNWVRQGFGLLLLGVALVLINRVYDNSYVLFLWAAVSMAFAVWFWRWAGRGRFIAQVFGVVVFAWGLIQLAGVAAGQSDPWHPLAGLKKQNAQVVAAQSTPVIHSLSELAVMQQKNPRLLVDLTADWCVSCRIMERELFSGQDIKGLSNWTRVKLDVTESNENSKAVLKSLNLFGPPVLIFYRDGQEIKRVVGETKQDELTEVLEKL